MTAKGVYEAVLTELNKLQAPSITLEDFNYFANKAISQYINKGYNTYDVNQQSTDSLRVLKATTILTPVKASVYSDYDETDPELLKSLYGATYDVNLPDDYLHILNCVCVFRVNRQHSCHNQGDYYRVGASRLTADAWSQIINNFYMRPSYKRPYYYIHNVNTQVTTPTNPIELDSNGQIQSGTDYSDQLNAYINNFRYKLRGGYINGTDQEIDNFIPERDELDLSKFNLVSGKTTTIEPNGAMFIILAIPINAKIESIIDDFGFNQIGIYTTRYYQQEPIISYTTESGDVVNLKLIFLGGKQPISGKYTITIK